jgi:hypothetical protein
MSDDPRRTSEPNEQLDEKFQNRRQFFNSLGIWSAIVVACVSFLKGGAANAAETDSTGESAGRPEGGFLKVRGPEPTGARPWWKHSNWDKHGDSVSGGGKTREIQ